MFFNLRILNTSFGIFNLVVFPLLSSTRCKWLVLGRCWLICYFPGFHELIFAWLCFCLILLLLFCCCHCVVLNVQLSTSIWTSSLGTTLLKLRYRFVLLSDAAVVENPICTSRSVGLCELSNKEVFPASELCSGPIRPVSNIIDISMED